jgi:simple sugar transport system ATP-binding protein
VFDFMRAAQAKGSSAIFISHNIYHAYGVSDRFVILDRGRVIMEADKAQISSAEQLVEDLRMIARTGQRLS